MVSHELDQIREFCTSAVIIDEGKLTYYHDLEEGIDVYTQDADNKKSLFTPYTLFYGLHHNMKVKANLLLNQVTAAAASTPHLS